MAILPKKNHILRNGNAEWACYFLFASRNDPNTIKNVVKLWLYGCPATII
jgi:hypothetical protein